MPADLPNHFLTLMEQSFVNQLNDGFKLMLHYARSLFFIIATIEVIIFAIFSTLTGRDIISQFILKVFKLSVIFMVISWYPELLQSLINGFSDVAFSIGGHMKAGSSFIFEPDHLWQLGLQNAMLLLQNAVKYGSLNSAMSTLYDVLGFGLLALFALIAAQILVCIVGFYLVSLFALLVIPLGAFSQTARLFEKAIAQVFCAGAKVFTIIVIICISTNIWSQLTMGLTKATASAASIDLSHALVFFFATMVICVLCFALPKLVANSIGEFRGEGFNMAAQHPAPIITSSGSPSSTPHAIPTHATTVPTERNAPLPTQQNIASMPAHPQAALMPHPTGTASSIHTSPTPQNATPSSPKKVNVNVSLSDRAIKQLQRGLRQSK